MIETLQSAKVIVCVGSGGVGKTTVAAALGFLMAKKGRRVLVLTIDPSQRLKTTLGLKDTGEISQISHPQIKGQLSAAVINAKKIFDEFIRRAAQKDELAEKILRNKLYVQLSTTLSGSQEFTALEKLYSTYESGNYDLIILDTPPTKHAIDFLHAPQKLSVLFNEGVAKWFRRNPASEKKRGLAMLAGILQAGSLQVMRVLEMLTGSEFMRELSDFFRNIEAWQFKLEDRVNTVHRLLVNPDTHFFLVTAFDLAKLKEAEYFGREIQKGGYHLSCIIINRAFPQWLKLTQVDDKARTPVSKGSRLVNFYEEMKRYYQERDQTFELFAKGFLSNSADRNFLFRIPEFDRDLSDLKDVAELAQLIEDNETRGKDKK